MKLETISREQRNNLELDEDAATRPGKLLPEPRRRVDPAFEQARSVGLRLEREPQDDGGDKPAILYRIFVGRMLCGRYWTRTQTLCIGDQQRQYKTISDALLAIASLRGTFKDERHR